LLKQKKHLPYKPTA